MKRYIKSAVNNLANEPYEIQEELVCDKDAGPAVLMNLTDSRYASIRYDIV